MQIRHLSYLRPSLAFMLLVLFMAALWTAGGASQSHVLGQSLVRAGAWLSVVAVILFGQRPSFTGTHAVLFLLLGSILLALAQLIPLPPAFWQALPGRTLLADAATLSGQPQPWRPWSIVSSATINAASSLIVPVTVLVLATSIAERERRWLLDLLLLLALAHAVIGILQFSGGAFDNPLINDSPGAVSGMFANRNHFALFMAIGCLILPVWAFAGNRGTRWRRPVALGLLPLFALTLLASGSRVGLLLGLLAVAIGLLVAQRGIKRELRDAPRWVLPTLIGSIVTLLAILVVVSVAADRAVSLDRVFAMDAAQDFRRRALPTVLEMIGTYFPAGTGLGTFDPVFRIHEPFALLKGTYFNHAHNDFLEIVLDGGLPGLLLLGGALIWWAYASLRAWQADALMAKLGSAILLLILVASIFDYPARTPIIMGVIVVAGLWLTRVWEPGTRPALPAHKQHL